jgi:hypothetical protein
MTHTSLQGRAAEAVKRAISETNTADGLDAIGRVLYHMVADTGFQVDKELQNAQRLLEKKQKEIVKPGSGP